MPDPERDEPLRRLTTRSVVLSVLLGYDKQALSAQALVRVGESFGVAENGMRVTLSRMVAGGDLVRTEAGYGLPPRLLERQRRQLASLRPAVRPWTGGWHVVVLSSSALSRTDRSQRRRWLGDLRLAQLRDGVWVRPDNLDPAWTPEVEEISVRFAGALEGDPVALAERLWGLRAWSDRSRALAADLDVERPPVEQMALAASIVRHIGTDPMLPPELLPAGWAGPEIRASYERYRLGLIALHRRLLAGGT